MGVLIVAFFFPSSVSVRGARLGYGADSPLLESLAHPTHTVVSPALTPALPDRSTERSLRICTAP